LAADRGAAAEGVGKVMSNLFYGWFDDATQKNPTSEIPRDSPCLFCGNAITSDDVRTHNMMFIEGYAKRSYFYQTHRTCSIKWGDRDLTMDQFIIDMIQRNGD
jgi:hypothetical protein